jgi:Ubiquitin-conjugating enzyme
LLAVIAVTQVKFNTRIYHPNIKTDTGDICTDVLNDNWGPTLNVRYVLNALKQVSSKHTAFHNVRPILMLLYTQLAAAETPTAST